jgi:hypothetical protein
LPRSSILASNPAVRPTAIHATMPITDSFGRQRNDVCASQLCWVDRGGRIILPRVTVPSVGGVLGGTAAYNEKSGPCHAPANVARVQLPGSGATFFMHYTFPDCRILGFGADHSAADGSGGRPAFSNMRAWPPGGEHLRADTRAARRGQPSARRERDENSRTNHLADVRLNSSATRALIARVASRFLHPPCIRSGPGAGSRPGPEIPARRARLAP